MADDILRTISPTDWTVTRAILRSILLVAFVIYLAVGTQQPVFVLISAGMLGYVIYSDYKNAKSEIEINEDGFTYTIPGKSTHFPWDKLAGVYWGSMTYGPRVHESNLLLELSEVITPRNKQWFEFRTHGLMDPGKVRVDIFERKDLADLIRILKARAPNVIIDPRVIEFLN